MRSRPHERCPNCAGSGTTVHRALRDQLHGAPGSWDMRRCSNHACGVHWLDPQPVPEDLGIAYDDYYTHYASPSSPGASRPAKRAFVARRLRIPTPVSRMARLSSFAFDLSPGHAHAALYGHFYLRPRRGGSLLEVGCGAGEQLQAMASDGWRVRGIDFDAKAVAVARSRGLDVLVGDLRDQALPNASFDAVVMAQVFEHVYDPPGLLDECARLLAPGGHLVCITPNADALGHRVYGRAWRGLEPPRHITIYTARALRLACAKAGLRVERLFATARDAANMFLASERIAAAGDDALIERPSTDRSPPLRLHAFAALESAGSVCGLGWGEELVLIARKAGGPA
jgi:2-polyprenyl-3-methyl-5-hydroxy-6-metoxy-1,4-benzoquinol methylase